MRGLLSRIRRHWIDPESDHRRIATGFLWVSFFVLIAKLAGAAKEMTIAWRYGVSATVDAYVFVFNLVSWPVSIWFSVLTVVLVPLIAHFRKDNPGELVRFRGELSALTLLLGVALWVFCWFGLPQLLSSGWTGLTGESLGLAQRMAEPLSLQLPLGLVIGLFSVWIMAEGRHYNTILEAIPSLVILVALLLPAGMLTEPLIWGTIAGYALHLAGLAWPLRRIGVLPMPRISFQSPDWRWFWSGIGIMSLGQLLTSFTGIVDQFLAAGLQEGALSSLSYANRILGLVLSLGALAIGRATLPIFSRAHADGESVSRFALKWTHWMFIAAVPLALILIITSTEFVGLLFERGAFTSEDTREVAKVLRWSLIQLPFYFGGLVMVSALAATKRYFLIALSGAANLFFKLMFAFLLVDEYQLVGVVLSTVIMYVFSVIFLYVSMRQIARNENRLRMMS